MKSSKLTSRIQNSVIPKINLWKTIVPIVVDDESLTCLEYADQGYRCVPYYSCEDGEIIIDGAGLFNPRFGGLDDVAVSPENSKCQGALEMCCRHPDWFGIPITTPVKITKPPPSVLVPCPDDNDNLIDPNIPDPSEPCNPEYFTDGIPENCPGYSVDPIPDPNIPDVSDPDPPIP